MCLSLPGRDTFCSLECDAALGEARMLRSINKFRSSDAGASLIEYSLLTGLISLGILTAISLISSDLAVTWSTLASIVSQAAS